MMTPVAASNPTATSSVKTLLAKRVLGIEEDTSTITLQETIDRFIATYSEVRNKARTVADNRYYLGYLASLATRKLRSIRTPELEEVIASASESLNMRRHIFVATRTMLRWATRQRIIKTSPLQDIQVPGKVTVRNRVLSDDEMARIYKAALKLGYPFGFICLVAIHTGLRRGEVGQLKWSWITSTTITLPAEVTKNRRALVLPNLIGENLALIPKTSGLLFPSSIETPFTQWYDGKVRLDELCGVEHFVLHDFRRYFSTTMAMLRVPIDVTEAMLNHVTGSRSPLQRIYDHHDRLPEMRKALELYERHLASILA